MATLEDVARLQSVTEDVVLLAQQDAAAALRRVDLSALDRLRPRLEAEVGDVLDGYGYGLSAIAADWYSDARLASPAVGRFVPVARTALTDQQLGALVGWSLGPLYSDTPDLAGALARLDGGVQRVVANAARETVTENVVRDPARASYYRGASANCCAFCAMLTTRIYTRQSSADFQAHDHDRCFPVPIWPGQAADLPPYYADFHEEYERAAKAASAAGEGRTAKTVLRRMRQATGRK